MIVEPFLTRRSNVSSDAFCPSKNLFGSDDYTTEFKDVPAACSTVIDTVSCQSDEEPLRVVPFLEIKSPFEKRRRIGRLCRNGSNTQSSRAESTYSQTPSESRSLRLLQWSCLFPREICFEETQDCLPGDMALVDPTEPIVFDQMDNIQDPILVQSAQFFQVLLEQHQYNCSFHEEDDEEFYSMEKDGTVEVMLALLRECPSVAQVQYPLPSDYWMDKNVCYSYPLIHFCVTGCLEGLFACYQAFPEAIGTTVHGWLPLHFAARHSSYPVVRFLLEKFPNAARRTHPRTHRTPLHVACQRRNPVAKSSVVRRIMQHYPTALQLADRHGWIPVHHLCACQSTDVYLLQTLIEASPSTIRATTRKLELPLHILCRYGSCRSDSIAYLVDSVHADAQQIYATDLDQNSVLHCVAGNPSATMDALRVILSAIRGKSRLDSMLSSTNLDHKTPAEIASRHLDGENKPDIQRALGAGARSVI